MQKKVIALAVAGMISGVAFAQTNVTVYGVADAFYGYSAGDNVDFSGISSGGLSGGRIGFKGEEALGNGLKAIFTYEFGSLNIDTQGDNTSSGNGMTSTRQSFVGLSSAKLGTLSVGRQYAPSFLFLGGTSSNEVTIVNPSNLFVPQFATVQTGGGARWNNSVAYHSPVFGGFDARVIYGFGEQLRDGFGDASTDQSQIGAGVRYANGPIYLTAMYQAILEDEAVATNNGNKAWAIGGAYDFKVVKLFANYIREKDERSVTKKNWSLGLSVPVSTVGSVNVEYSQYKTDVASNTKAKGLGIGYNHFMSKRTTGYVNLSHIKNDDGLALGFNGVGTAGDSNTHFAVGMRHVF